MNISLRQMRAFAAVCRHGSFTQAAVALHLSQSAVSMLVRQLESEMNLVLFNRGKTSVTLTDAGRQLLPLVQRMLDDLETVKSGASDLRSLRRGVVRVAVSQMLACTWLPPVLKTFATRYPEIEVILTDSSTDGVADEVLRHEADIGLGPLRPTSEEILTEPFLDVGICFVCPASHKLARRRQVTWDDTRNEKWVAYSDEFFRQLEQTLSPGGIERMSTQASKVSYLTTALALVGSGSGVTAAPAYVASLAPYFDVRFVPFRSPTVVRTFQIYSRAREVMSPATTAFVSLLREVSQDAVS
ncbi:LysR family transcriptional regulator [Variovorax sp. VNK109]|uniref:LysR family transcriptional regulator n=1 Tax=Variovorax sp. VNK109 TaxID=3400919 RepID=UPI003C119107